MKRLYWYTLQNFLTPLVATFFISMFILVMQFLWLYIEQLVGKGLEAEVVIELLYYAVLGLIPRGLPLSVLLASIMAFGNMGERLELLSIKAAGVSLFKVMTPMVLFVVLLSLGNFVFLNTTYPNATRKLRVLLWDIKRAKPEMNLRANEFNSDIPGFTIRISGKDELSGLMRDVKIYDQRDNTNGLVMVADSGYMKTSADEHFMILTLFSGRSYSDMQRGKKDKTIRNDPFRRDTFETEVLLVDLDEGFKKTDDENSKNQYFSKNIVQLALAVDSLSERSDGLSRAFLRNKVRRRYQSLVLNRRMTVLDSARIEQVNLDSLFLISKLDGQSRTMASALTIARKQKQDITSRKKQSVGYKAQIARHIYEIHNRYALAVVSLLLMFIGAPLGAIVRKGGFGLPVVLSVFFFILYYVVDSFGKHLALEMVTPVWFGAWLSSMVLLPIGVFLTRQATADSVILNADNYLIWINKIVKRKNKSGDKDKNG